MNKVSPAKIKALFKAQVDELTQFFVRVADRIEGKQNEKADLSQLAQSIFLSASVAFEVTLSDLFTAYANRKPQRLQVEYEERIRKSVRDKFGEWVNRISMPHAQHIPYDNIKRLLDSDEKNLTFKDSEELKERAAKLLSPPYSTHIMMLPDDDAKLLDTVKAIRDYIAHQSTASRTKMNTKLHELGQGGPNSNLGRGSKQVHSAGSFLKAITDGNTRRVTLYLRRLTDIVNRMPN